MRNLLIITVAGLLSLAGPAAGQTANPGPHPSFSGTWRLDIDASDSLDAMLKLQGVSALKRHAMAETVVTQTIEQTEERLTIRVDSKHRHTVEHLVLDGTPVPVTTQEGQRIVWRARWSADGQAVVAEARVTLKDGRPATLEIRRRLAEDGASLLMDVILRPEGGPPIHALRVFRRGTGSH